MKSVFRRFGKKMCAFWVALTMIISGLGPQEVHAQSVEEIKDSYTGNGFQVEFTVVNQWEGEYEGQLVLKNVGSMKLENWCLGFTLDGEITSVWNGTLVSHAQDQYRINNAGWNQDIKVGKEISVGFIAKGKPDALPENYYVQSTKRIVATDRYTVKYTVVDAWEGGYNVSIEIVNTSESVMQDWEIIFPYHSRIQMLWNGEQIDSQDGFCTVKNAGYNQNIYPGGSVTFGFTCDGEVAEEPAADQIQLTEYVAEETQREEPAITTRPIPTATAEGASTETEEPIPTIGDVTVTTEEPVPTDATGSDDVETGILDDLDVLEQYVYLEYAPGNMAESVVEDIQLINELPETWDVAWQSSDPSVVSVSGQVCRDKEDHDIILTAVLKKGDQEYQLEYPVSVVAARDYHPEDIEDLCVEDLEEMNADDVDYECMINDYGYLDTIYGKYSTVRVDSYESALYSLYSVRTALGLTDPLTELIPYRAEANSGGQTYRFTQIINGVECFDNIIIVGCDCDGIADYLSSSYYPAEGAVNAAPSFDYVQCREKLLQEFPGAEITDPETPRIFIINYYGHRDLAWEMYLSLKESSGEYENGSYQVLMGAQDGKRKFMQKLENDSAGVSYRGNDLDGMERTIRVEKKDKNYILKNPQYNFQLYQGDYKVDSSEFYSKDAVKYQKEYDAKAQEISAMHSLERIHKSYDLKFSRKGYDGKKTKLDVVLLGNTCQDEAGWYSEDKEAPYMAVGMGTGKGLTYIDPNNGHKKTSKTVIGKEISYAASSDVLCHELTHGIVNSSVEDNKAGSEAEEWKAVKEAYSDIGACVVNGENEGSRWRMAENLYKGDHATRDLANPHEAYGAKQVFDRWYIDSKKCKDADGSHQNSTIISHAFYRMYQLAEEKNREYQAEGKDGKLEASVFDHAWYNSISKLKQGMGFYQVRVLFLKACKNYCKSIRSDHTGKYEEIIKQAFDEANVTFIVNTTLSRENKKADEQCYTRDYFNEDITFQGKVVEAEEHSSSENQKNLEDVLVEVCDMEGTELGDLEMTGENGKYEVKSELADEYVLYFDKAGYISEELYLDQVDEKLQSVYSCPLVELIPESEDEIGGASGTIKNAVNLKGVEGLNLSLRRGINHRLGSPDATGTTGSDGSYQFKGLTAGCYCMEISGKGFETAYMDIKILGGRVLSGQDGYISKDLKKGQVRVVLTWGEAPKDLDAHMVCRLSCGEEYEVDYTEMEFRYKGKKICALDVDDLTSYGPETVTIYNKKAGKFTYAVHRFCPGRLGDSDACVQVYLGSGNQSSYTFYVPACGEENYWTVFRYNAATNHINPINEIGYEIKE